MGRMRIALTLSLILAAAPAWAEWVKVGRTVAAVHYVDPATVQKDGSLRRVWALQDMVETSPEGVMSIRALQEYDCADERFRYLSLAAHSRSMARGEVLAEHELRDAWNSRPPGAKASAIGKIVCAP
jgi:hypothetical protein